jgi:probable rRNA maturation factor
MSTEPNGLQREDDGLLLFDRGTATLRRRPLKAFAEKLQQDVADGRPFACLLTRDPELQRLNREFLKKDYATDVLSFPSGGRAGFLGEIAISVDRARDQAAEEGHTLDDEIKILMLHGVLHLLGMDHETDSGRMARTEIRWRKQFQLPAGLIERALP